jgi:hypothetical protein
MKDGGHAFPCYMGSLVSEPGMSLRDWYAGQALHVIIPKPKTVEDFKSIDEFSVVFAEIAYQIADVMIETREKSNAAERT